MKLLEAIKFAILMHDGQRRKLVDEPYICHPMRVTQLVAFYLNIILGEKLYGTGIDTQKNYSESQDDALVIAVLHDTLEDTETLYQDLVDNFGEFVAKSVYGLTNPMKKEDEKRLDYKKRVHERLSREPDLVKIIKMCDRLDNLRSMKTGAKKWRDKYCEETRDLLRNIGDAHSVLASTILLEVEELESLKV